MTGMIRGKFRYDAKRKKLIKIKEPKKVIVPFVQTDEVHEGIHSMADDKMYSSKSAYRRSLKEQGYRETGGEHLKDRPYQKTDAELEREIREDAERAYHMVKNNEFPFTEKEKQQHIEEERWIKSNS